MHSTQTPDTARALAHYTALAAQAQAQAADLAITQPHTPGPWVWEGASLRPADPRPDAQHVHTILEREGGGGFLGSDWRATMRELDADYRLIAAAPLLLEALQKCADVLAAVAGSSAPHTLAKARAAIFDATGRAA